MILNVWPLQYSFHTDDRHSVKFSPPNVEAPFHRHNRSLDSEQLVTESLVWQSYQETADLLSAFRCPQGISVLCHCFSKKRKSFRPSREIIRFCTVIYIWVGKLVSVKVSSFMRVIHEVSVYKGLIILSLSSVLFWKNHNSLPNGFLNAVLAETVTAGCLNSIPKSHEADGTLVFNLQGRVKLHVVALEGLIGLKTGGVAEDEGARRLWRAEKGLSLFFQHRQGTTWQLSTSSSIEAILLQTPLVGIIASHLWRVQHKIAFFSITEVGQPSSVTTHNPETP